MYARIEEFNIFESFFNILFKEMMYCSMQQHTVYLSVQWCSHEGHFYVSAYSVIQPRGNPLKKNKNKKGLKVFNVFKFRQYFLERLCGAFGRGMLGLNH